MIRKCLAIGVSTVEPVAGGSDFPYLDGAIDAAETIGQWARKSGFADSDVIVLTDKDDTVTEQKLKDAFTALLPQGAVTDHLIVSFAGHGQTGISDDITYWLMSDSLDQGYQIFVEQMRRQLYNYGIKHLTIFSDACRAIALSQDLRALEPRSGVQLRHAPPDPAIQVARFNACPDATKAFMVRNPSSAARGKCVFSGVLAEALWGRVPDAIDDNVIDSASLGRGLYAAVTARAKTYGLDLVPGGNAVFDKLIYFDKATPPGAPDPDLPPWPPTGSAESANAGASGSAAEPASRGADSVFASLDDSDEDGSSDGARAELEAAMAKEQEESSLEYHPWEENERVSAERAVVEDAEFEQALATRAAQQQHARSLGVALRDTRAAAKGDAAELVTDAPVKQIWSDTAAKLVTTGDNHFTLPATAGLLAIEFADGMVAPVWHYPGLSCAIVRDTHGVAALSYHSPGAQDKSTDVAAKAIVRMATGQLSAQAIDALAADLRNDKHINPVLGAIAAYCYDITGDLDSIRRMAWYYRANNQAAPYDLIFLSMSNNDGRTAKVDGVPADSRRPPSAPIWLRSATQDAEVGIAGRCPWLRQGWDFLATAEDVERPMAQGLLDLRTHLQPSTFTTFDAAGGQQVIARWGLKPCLPG